MMMTMMMMMMMMLYRFRHIVSYFPKIKEANVVQTHKVDAQCDKRAADLS